MYHQKSILTFLAVATLAVGCTDEPTAAEPTAAEPIDTLKTETKAAAAEIRLQDYEFVQRNEFTEKMRAQLDDINTDLDQLDARLEKSGAAANAEAKPKLQELRKLAAKLDEKLSAAGTATESTWEQIKTGATEAYDDLKQGFTLAREWVSEKIAP